MKQFKDKVKECRGRMGISQKDLAEKAGIGYRTITSYESGERFPQSTQLYKLAEALSVSADYLRDDTITDPSYNIELNLYVEQMYQREGAKGALDVESLLKANQALFAGGTLSEEAKDQYFQALMLAYTDCKRAAQERYGAKEDKEHKSAPVKKTRKRVRSAPPVKAIKKKDSDAL